MSGDPGHTNSRAARRSGASRSDVTMPLGHLATCMHSRRRGLPSGLVILTLWIGSGCVATPAVRASPTSSPSPVPSSTATAPAVIAPLLNPLTGLPVADPSLLKIPAVLISISHFPATGRPQAGLSFAPFVYEFYITEGATRFLAVFYGEFPAVEVPVKGGCETRAGAFVRTGLILGGVAWFDANANGLRDPGEGGVDGLCINLYDARGNLIQRTSTDTNGRYGFNVDAGSYSVEFVKPEALGFAATQAGDGLNDSDADTASGRARVDDSSDVLSVDAGLIPLSGLSPTSQPGASLPAAQVGPIRSGRLIYRHIGRYFQNSCLIYASASPEELPLLPKCLTVFHQVQGGGFMLPLSDMRDVAEANRRKLGSGFDYSGNAYSAVPPGDGSPAAQLRVFIAYQNQSGWFYDPLYQAYLRYVDTSIFNQAGVLHPDTDRLTSRQLHFENVIVLFAKHQVISPTNLDIHLDAGRTGKALLFRDGQVYNIAWSTIPESGEAASSVRPIRFLGTDSRPVSLKPGHTWIIVVTPESTVTAGAAGQWVLTFSPPEGAK